MNKRPQRRQPTDTSATRQPAADAVRTDRPLRLLAVAVSLVVLVLIAYWGVGWNSLVCIDDGEYVADNYQVMHGLSWEGLKWSFTTFHASNWHPLTWLSLMSDTSLIGAGVRSYHFMNVALHILSTLVLLGLLYRMTGRLWASAFVAAFFALHPLHVESVAWAAERKDVLSTFFMLASLCAYIWYVRKPGAARYAAVAGLFALSLMSKPMMVTLPLLLLLLDYWPLERVSQSDRRQIGRLVLEKLPFFLMSVASSVVTLAAQKGAMADIVRLDLPSRLSNAIVSYGVYLWQMFWPLRLAVLYSHPARPQYAPAACVLILLVAITAAVVYFGRSRRYLLVGWLWYLISLIPVIGIVQVGGQAHADRYTYVPLIGLFIMIAWGVGDLIRSYPILKAPTAALAAVLLVAASFITGQTVSYWRDDIALFGRAVEVGQRNRWTLGNLGSALGNSGRIDEGVAYLKESLTLGPDDARIRMSIGSLMLTSNRLQESYQYHLRALELDPSMKEANAGMALTLLRMGRPQEAIPYCEKAIGGPPGWAHGYNAMGMVLADIGKLDESLASFRQAISLNPNIEQFYNNMATAYIRKGDLASAADTYKRGLAVAPSVLTWQLLGRVQLQRGLLQEAERCMRGAMSLSPDSAELHVNLAVVLAKEGRSSEAIAELRTALALEPGNEHAISSMRTLTSETGSGN
jgi:protein O-mannosyl-transferase